MDNTSFESFVLLMFRAWRGGKRKIRIAMIAIFLLALAVSFAVALRDSLFVERRVLNTVIFAAFSVSVILGAVVGIYQIGIEGWSRQERIERVEEQVREHPERPQLAWDLARAKLESYLDRNLAQVRSVYWLTLLVMSCGFGFVLFGLMKAFDSPDKLPVSIVASGSGILISFIGGSFLFIYRTILLQSKDYVMVLERINAVGMAVQVISSMPDVASELKNEATAGLAKQLLGLYAIRSARNDHEGNNE